MQRILAERIGELGDHYGIVAGLVDTNGQRVVSRGSFDHGEQRALDRNTLFEGKAVAVLLGKEGKESRIPRTPAAKVTPAQ
ncbi:MAG: hypothetical protein ABI895_06225 [Deltaproteobacteria bacterium]